MGGEGRRWQDGKGRVGGVGLGDGDDLLEEDLDD